MTLYINGKRIPERRDDNVEERYGSGNDVYLNWETSDADAHYLNLAITGASRNFIISEDRNIDWGHAAQTNPTLWIHSADSTDVNDYLSLAHDQTDARFDIGTGSYIFTDGGYAGVNDPNIQLRGPATGNPRLSFYQTTNEMGYIQYTDAGDILRIDSDGSISLAASNTTYLTVNGSGSATALAFTDAVHSPTADTEKLGAYFNFSSTKTWPAAVAPPQAAQREIYFAAPTYTGNAAAASTITDATTVYIDAAPTQGANMTLTNRWGFWIDNANIRLDGLLEFGAAPSAGTSATRYQIYRTATPTLAYRTPTTVAHQFFSAAVELLTMTDTNIVFNEGGADIDFRIESDNLTNILHIDAALDVIGIGAAGADNQFITITERADTSGVPKGFTFIGAAHTGLTAATEVIGVDWDVDASKTWAAGAGPLAQQREIIVRAPTYVGDVGAALTISDAATVYINAGPTAGANMTITRSHALQLADSARFSLGTTGDAMFVWDTTDANANMLKLGLPAGDATSVPIFAIGRASTLIGADLGLLNGATDPSVVVFNTVGTGYLRLVQGANALILTNTGDIGFGDASGLIFSSIDVTAGGETVFNENSVDIDFRVESNNVTNIINVDANLDVISFGGAGVNDQFITITERAETSGTPSALVITGAAHTGITAATEAVGININQSATKTWAAGAGPLATQREFVLQRPTYTGNAAGALTITTATLLSLGGNPVDGANMTLTTSRVLSIEAASSGAGTLTNTIGLDIADQSIAAATTGFAIRVQSQTANATTTRALEIVGTGVNNAIRLGASPNIYSNAAETIRLMDSTDANGIFFTLAVGASQLIRTVSATTGSLSFQSQTFTAGAVHTAMSLSPGWAAENFNHIAFSITATQNGANSGGLRGLSISLTKATGATILNEAFGILLAAPTVTGTITSTYGLYVGDQSAVGSTNSFAINIVSQTANATTTRALNIVGTGVNNAIRLGGSPNIYSSGAEVIRFDDSTAARGIAFTLTAAGAQDIAATAGNLQITGVAGAGVIFNEAGADIDFRIESDGNANMFHIDSGINGGAAGTGGVGIGQVAQSGALLTAGWSAYTMGAGTTAARHFYIQGNVTELAGAAITDIVGAYFNTFTVTDGGGAETVDILSTVYIPGAPTAGTAPTNGPYSFFVDSGTSRFDAEILLNHTGVVAGTPLNIDYGRTAYTTAVGLIDVVRSGALTGVDTQSIIDLNIVPSFTLTEPGGGSVNLYGANIDLSGISVTAGVGSSFISALRLVANADADVGTNLAADVSGDVRITSGRIYGGGVQFNKQDLGANTDLIMDENDSVVNVTSGAVSTNTITLPAASGNEGMVISVYLTTDGGQNAVVTRAGADVIQNGSADLANTTVTLDDAGDFCMLQCVNSSMWQVLVNSGGAVA